MCCIHPTRRKALHKIHFKKSLKEKSKILKKIPQNTHFYTRFQHKQCYNKYYL